MKIACIIRQVPDAEAKLPHTSHNNRLELGETTLAIDGMDEYGVEQALRLVEQNGAETLAIAIGPARIEDAIRRALAMGLERAVHLETDEELDLVRQAQLFAALIVEEKPNLVFIGGQQADSDWQGLGPALAEVLAWPQVTWTTEMQLTDVLQVTHDVDDGKEMLELALPAVITTQQGLNEPRYPTLPNIMKAKKKEIAKKSLSEFGFNDNKVTIIGQMIQEKARIGKIINEKDPKLAAKQLIDLLHNEAKLI